MNLLSVNSPLSLQESELVLSLLQQRPPRGNGQGPELEDHKTRQNLPPGTNALPDPDLSPQSIEALLLTLQVQQASLVDTPAHRSHRKTLAEQLG